MKRVCSLCVCIALLCALCSCGQQKSSDIMLLRAEEGKEKTYYYPVVWDLETGETQQESPIATADNDAIIFQIWWDGEDYLVADEPFLNSERCDVKTATYWASCYKDSILMYPDKEDDPAEFNYEKLILLEKDGQKREYDISGLTTEDGRYYGKDLRLFAFMMDEERLYILFAPAMMVMENLPLYIAELDKSTGDVQRVSVFDAPPLCSPADEAGSANICAIEGEGIFFFDHKSVIKIDPKTMKITESFSSASFDGEAPDFLIKKLGYYQCFLIVNWKDKENPDGDYYASAVKDGKVVATVNLKRGCRWFFPNVLPG